MREVYKFCPSCQSPLEVFEEEYLACSSDHCNFVHYGNPTPVVAAIVEYEERQILLAHNTQWPEDWYALITGFLERNEHPDEAVLREVQEELGVMGELVSFVGHYPFYRMNQILLVYHVRVSGKINLNEELDDYKIIPFSEVTYWPAGTGYAVRDFLISKGETPVEVPFSGM
ncbi:NUDIX domain-containing protein [Aquimarina hainanensis]|uniref:NUDIX domain-containing protein n=1 Tax=Aquimarina hainanensis TaxID=1578017 RepID=A0ABW5N1Q3_9FLAO